MTEVFLGDVTSEAGLADWGRTGEPERGTRGAVLDEEPEPASSARHAKLPTEELGEEAGMAIVLGKCIG